MSELTVLIPFFNEERTLAEVVTLLEDCPAGLLHECIFIDDGSSDLSLSILRQRLEKSNLNARILVKSNGGKSSAIEMGTKVVSTSHVIILDADLELNPQEIPRLWEIVTSGISNYVFGYRNFHSHSSFTWRYARGNQIISNFYGLVFNEVITDVMCGFKLVPSEVLKNLPFRYRKFGLEIEIPMSLWKARIRPYEVPVSYAPRSRSQGKTISVKDAFGIFVQIVHFRLVSRRNKDL